MPLSATCSWQPLGVRMLAPTSGVGQTDCGAAGPKPGTSGVRPEPGSSISNNASDVLLLLLNSRLVTAVFRKTVMLTVGMTLPTAGATPPVQVSVMSPVCSV